MKLLIEKIQLLFSFAFRPLFLLVALQAQVHILLWYAVWNGLAQFPFASNPVYWHGHEMIAGFAGAAIAGFLLTAVATWTGRPQVRGWPLAVLCLSWCLARLGPLYPGLAAGMGVFYWLWLLLLMGKEVVLASNTRNYKILFVLMAFLLLESLYQYALIEVVSWQRQVLWLQIWLVIVMINLIGGRIIPAFTRNWLVKQHGNLATDQQPAAFGKVDIAATITLLLFFAATVLPLSDSLIPGLAFLAATLQAWRLIRWKGYLCFADPLVWMMHLSYAWIPVGLIMFGLGQLGFVTISAGIHALTIGTVVSMIISVAARAALGHTGRELESHPLLTTAIVLISVAAMSRVAAAIYNSDLLLDSATLFWSVGFACFALRYIPVLTKQN